MRKLQIVLMAGLWIVVPARSQEQQAQSTARSFWDYGVPNGRTFFPHDWVRGFTQFEGAPPHNEPDLGRCGATNPPQGVNSPCTAFARYMISGYMEVQPFGRTFLRHAFLFYEPRFSFGRNVPQVNYTASFEPMAYERSIGFGFELPKNLELRFVEHSVKWLGRYGNSLGAADLGTTGPYGLYSTVGLRWYYGGYGRSDGGRDRH